MLKHMWLKWSLLLISHVFCPSWKKWPSKPCRTTSALIGDSYITAGQVGEVFDTMPALQVYQADVYKDEGADFTP